MLFITGSLDSLILTGLFMFLIILELYVYKKMGKTTGTSILFFILVFSLFFIWYSYGIDFPFSPYFQMFMLFINLLLLITKMVKKK